MNYPPTLAPTLPLELHEDIIDIVQDSIPTLRACVLVCHAWMSRSRSYLFRDFAIRSVCKIEDCSYNTIRFLSHRDKLTSLITDLSSTCVSPPASSLVRNLSIFADYDESFCRAFEDVFNSDVNPSLSFGTLKSVAICEMVEVEIDGLVKILRKNHLTLESLAIHNVSFRYVDDLGPLLSNLGRNPHLRSLYLSIDDTSSSKHSSTQTNVCFPRTVRPKLQFLHVGMSVALSFNSYLESIFLGTESLFDLSSLQTLTIELEEIVAEEYGAMVVSHCTSITTLKVDVTDCESCRTARFISSKIYLFITDDLRWAHVDDPLLRSLSGLRKLEYLEIHFFKGFNFPRQLLELAHLWIPILSNIVHFSFTCLPIWFRATRPSDSDHSGGRWDYLEIAHSVLQLDVYLSSLADRARNLKEITMIVADDAPSSKDIRELYPQTNARFTLDFHRVPRKWIHRRSNYYYPNTLSDNE